MSEVLFLTLFMFITGIAIAAVPFLRPAQALPPTTDQEQELQALRLRIKESEGVERQALIAQWAALDKQPLPSPKPIRSLGWKGALVITGVLAGVGWGLASYTWPQLPSTEVKALRAEAQELRRLESEARKHPSLANWISLGRRAFELKRYETATEAYLEAAQFDPSNLEAVRMLGIVLTIGGRNAEAVKLLSIVTQETPKDAEAWLYLGNANAAVGLRQAALSAWKTHQALDPKPQVEALGKALAGPLEGGRMVYVYKCASCHGANAEGWLAPSLQQSPILQVDAALTAVVSEGMGNMARVPLAKPDLEALLVYLKGL